MLILEDFSATPTIRIRTLPGVECCLALWTAQAPEREPMAETARSIHAAMPASATRALQTLNRGLPRWPLATTTLMFRLGGPTPEDALVNPDVLGAGGSCEAAGSRGRGAEPAGFWTVKGSNL